MQPLDKAFTGSLKIFYCQEIEKYLLSNLGRVVTVFQIGEQFGSAYERAATGEIAANGFFFLVTRSSSDHTTSDVLYSF